MTNLKNCLIYGRISPAKYQIMLPLKGALDQIGQLIHRPLNSLIYGCCLVVDCDRMAAGKAGFHHAVHVIMTGFLVAVHIAYVDLHVGDVSTEVAQGILYYSSDIRDQ